MKRLLRFRATFRAKSRWNILSQGVSPSPFSRFNDTGLDFEKKGKKRKKEREEGKGEKEEEEKEEEEEEEIYSVRILPCLKTFRHANKIYREIEDGRSER